LKPFKIQTKFKLVLLPGFLIKNPVGILNLFTKGKLLLLNLSSTLQSLEFFGGQEGLILYFPNQSNFVYWKSFWNIWKGLNVPGLAQCSPAFKAGPARQPIPFNARRASFPPDKADRATFVTDAAPAMWAPAPLSTRMALTPRIFFLSPLAAPLDPSRSAACAKLDAPPPRRGAGAVSEQLSQPSLGPRCC
jgi:hypothetical protein